MYMPGRLRTGASPSRTVMSADVYVWPLSFVATLPPANTLGKGSRSSEEETRCRGTQRHRFYHRKCHPPWRSEPLPAPPIRVPDHPDLRHRGGPEHLVGPRPDLLCQEPHLPRPRPRADPNDEDAAVQRDRLALGAQTLA